MDRQEQSNDAPFAKSHPKAFNGISWIITSLFTSDEIKKMSEVNKTRKNNNMLDGFLVDYLLCKIDDDSFEDFKNTPINEVLRYDRIGDLEALLELLNEKVNLKKVVKITI